jgi:hypothetical protein
MVDNVDPSSICRDDNCEKTDLHAAHDVPRRRVKSGARKKQNDWDPDGLSETVLKVVCDTEWPLAFSDVKSAVLNDFGSTTDRAIHRHLARLEEKKKIMRLELGLAFAAYIKPSSRFLKDPDNLREHLQGKSHGSASQSRATRLRHLEANPPLIPPKPRIIQVLGRVEGLDQSFGTKADAAEPIIEAVAPEPLIMAPSSIYLVTSAALEDLSNGASDATCYWPTSLASAVELAQEQSMRGGSTWRVLRLEVAQEFEGQAQPVRSVR